MAVAVRADGLKAYFARLPEEFVVDAAKRLGIPVEHGSIATILRAALLVAIDTEDEHSIAMARDCSTQWAKRRPHPRNE